MIKITYNSKLNEFEINEKGNTTPIIIKFKNLSLQKVELGNLDDIFYFGYEFEEELTDNWIPFYIGKSKDLNNRINQHITLEGGNSTYALKLQAIEILKNETFRLSFIKIDTDHYDLVMPKIEQELRKKLNPIIGKQ